MSRRSFHGRALVRLAVFCLATTALTSLLSANGHAAVTNWSDGTGSWFSAGNWTAGVPGAGDTATVGNGGTAQINAAASVQTLTINSFGATQSTVDLQAGGSLSASGGIFVGTGSASGTLLLSGSTNMTGPITLSESTIQSNVTGTLSNTITLNPSYGSFINTQSGTVLTLTGPVSGGSLVIEGSGTTVLAGTDSLPFFTIENGATAQIGNGATSGTLTSGNVDNLGTLIFNRTDTVTVADTIVGSGAINIADGTLIYTGSGVVSGIVTISPGATLQLGNGGTTGAVTGAIADNGTLVFDRSDSVTLPAGITGSGALTQAGSGTLTISSATGFNAITISAGTLQLNDPTSLGNAQITDNSALVFNLASSNPALVLSNAISGDGSVTVTGGGTVYFEGVNSYSGSTTIASNSFLQVGDATTHGTIGTGAIIDNGTLLFDRSDTVTLSNNISGSGTFYQTGTGTLILTGTNTSTGSIVIDGRGLPNGTLQIGNGGTGGGLSSGNVTDNGTLVFDHSDTITVANTISGTGALAQSGSGTVILTGANSYSGPTTINSGILQVGNGGTAGQISSTAITDNGTLAFDRSDSITIANTISGSGGLTQKGPGTLILDGTDTFTGTTTVASGILEVGDTSTPGATIAGPVNVLSGGTLSGHGTIKGAVTVASGGALRPGGTIGTLTVNGNLSLPSGSTLVAEVSPTAADQVNVSGTASLGGNLQLIADPGTYAAGTDFKLISAASVTGTFASITGNSFAGLNSSIQYSATGVDLILSQTPATTFLFGSYGTAPNQVAAGNALTAASSTGALYTALGALVGSSTAQATGALALLAGDIRPSLRAAAIEDSRVVRDTLLDRMDRAGDGANLWGAGFGGYGRLGGDANESNLHHDSAGFLFGADMGVLPGVALGVEAGYTSNSARTPGSLSTASGDSGHVGAYAAWIPGDVSLHIGGDYGFGSVSINRSVPQLALTASSSQDQETGQVFADLGYHIALDGVALEPHAEIAHITATGGAFTETGSAAALSGNEKSDSATYTMLGMRAGLGEMALGDDMTLVPRLDVGWQHALARLTPYQTVSYVNAGTSFAVLGTPLAQDAAALQAGLDLKVSPSATLFVSYDGSFSSTVENHAFRGGLTWHF